MSKKLMVIIIIIMSIVFSGCLDKTVPKGEIGSTITKEGNYTDIKIFKEMYLDDKLLVFYEREEIEDVFDNYIAEFQEVRGEYKFLNIYLLARNGEETFVFLYNSSGYIFLVKNEDIKYVQVFDDSGETIIEVDELPFTYFYRSSEDVKYQFIDFDGNVL